MNHQRYVDELEIEVEDLQAANDRLLNGIAGLKAENKLRLEQIEQLEKRIKK